MIPSIRHLLWLAMVFAASDCQLTAVEPGTFFENKIRPVLVTHCYECHSADSAELGGKLRLDSRDGMLTGGESGPVLLPGHPEQSLIIESLRHNDLEMPPDAPLPESVINDFVKWISLGAYDPRTDEPPRATSDAVDLEALWSFFPRKEVAIPTTTNPEWARDPIDHFVLAKIEDAGLTPTRDANPRTLVRRLYHDLVGLPPTTAQLDAFTAEHNRSGGKATERLVDSLLASPQFGVRWARHWLDVARYGESNGDDGLGRNATFPHAWRYRDYVVDAMNNDLPYDRFLSEQIAGDLLPASSASQRNAQLVATGFLAIGSKPAVAMNRNFAMDVVDDQINVVCTAVMGLSVACARCHDHKHDPIPTRDYYALAGIFSSSETLYGAAGNEGLTAPPTPLHELKSVWNESTENEASVDRTASPTFPESYSAAIAALKPTLHVRFDTAPDGLVAHGPASYSASEFATVKENRFVGKLDQPSDSYSVSFWFRNTLGNQVRAVTAYLFSRGKMGDSGLPGDHLGIGGNHKVARIGQLFVHSGGAVKKSVVGASVIPAGSWNHVVMVRAGEQMKVFLNGQLEIDEKLKSSVGDNAEFCLADRSDHFSPLDGNVGEFALFSRALTDGEAIKLHADSGQPRGIAPSRPIGFAMGVREKTKPVDCKIHINGEGSKLGPLVPRGTLTAYRTRDGAADSDLNGITIAESQSGRAALAQWLTDPEHPQTARVMVNRIWLHLFGQGIVATPDDFGVYGARPTHPELLDHLAERFVRQNWSIKRLIRSIVLTRTYQLDSHCDAEHRDQDPDNQLIARHHRRRLDAESLRDSMLAVSGTLAYSPQQGSAIEDVDVLINWPPGNSTDLHRKSNHRSLYLCMLRHAAPKPLAAFDLPDAVGVMGMRENTTLPTQALFLLNSDFVVDQAEHLAARLFRDEPSDERRRAQHAFAVVLQREASEFEVTQLLNLIQRAGDAVSPQQTSVAEPTMKAWASACQALLMTNEFRYVD
ncbi:Planctomycete cytochrome C [Novipirellula galeiformis]|uniref:Planctomycete cytochrome C n=1 Tax=Novipirellula galeiformis TaxID=2528004 RepID=A0A5C6CT89_9BACT|nr:DUF1553 domain-containing protein [Novipirellula galeiformis]TWU26266.1 Planctomycete cytochrome C [Novipirellula galeiformis]